MHVWSFEITVQMLQGCGQFDQNLQANFPGQFNFAQEEIFQTTSINFFHHNSKAVTPPCRSKHAYYIGMLQSGHNTRFFGSTVKQHQLFSIGNYQTNFFVKLAVLRRRVTSLRDPSTRHCATEEPGQHSFF